MASRGRCGGAPAREDELRRDERAEQQAPAPPGPVLPPPPPVDYGVFMQGLAQVQAQDHGGPSTMERFKRMLPPSFKGESDPLLAESWMREIEKIFRAIRSSDHKIKDCPRLQQGVQRGAPAPALAAAAPATGRPGRPRAPARVFALAREDAEQVEHIAKGSGALCVSRLSSEEDRFPHSW
ncbi:hypothetical protein Taro_027770 [Colocasia esculenta]|uniref:Uncharacterized protein n=1 Tax=Colocasia esculenta TaxID=4460 RepID=A0A843VEQ8_COLES|nr:hypothetical protein [Colocasia esculenta]